MFERFGEKAREATTAANEEARRLRHAYIGAEHILLGLLSVDSGARTVLEQLGVELNETRDFIRGHVGEGGIDAANFGQIPFTPRAKAVLERALREALSLGHNTISPEHILLGVANETGGVPVEILRYHDIDGDRVRHETIRQLAAAPPQKPPSATFEWTPDLERACGRYLEATDVVLDIVAADQIPVAKLTEALQRAEETAYRFGFLLASVTLPGGRFTTRAARDRENSGGEQS